jgi:type II secretory pathway component PulF
MSTFTYQAVKSTGERVKGEIEAASRTEAYRKLDLQNLQPLALTMKTDAPAARAKGGGNPSSSDAEKWNGTSVKLSHSQVIAFTEEITDLLEAGLQLEQALKVMEQRSEASALKIVSAALRQQVREGATFSIALRRASPTFGELYCNLVSAGELSGALPQILKRQLSYLQLIKELQERVTAALVYPSVIFAAGLGLILIFMTYLVPQLTVLFTKTGKGLPIATRILIGTSDFLIHFWWLILLVIFGLFALFRAIVSQPAGRQWWDRFRLHMPLVGPILSARFYAQFAQTLATLTTNGIPLLNALQLVNAATANVYMHDKLNTVTEAVGEGVSLSRSLTRTEVFPPVLIDMVGVGEQTGDLPAALEKIGQRYDKDLTKRIQLLTSLVQPLVIIMVAIVVGAVAFSMMSGIFQAISGLRGRM